MSDNVPVERWFSALCATPWLLILGAHSDACAAWLVLSHWPRPSLDDPKNLATVTIHLTVQVLFLAVVAAIPLLIATTARDWPKVLADSRYLGRVTAFVVGLVAIGILGQYDPGRVWAWLAD